jgi:NADP-dependent 3-hydroxy acid dehydrogenase YdfG
LARNPTDAKYLQSLAQQNKNVHPIKFDVSDEASINSAVEQVTKIAPHGIDVLINNAGIGGDGDVNVLNM